MNIIDVYGLAGCDNTRKALKEFRDNNIRVEFHDFKVAGLNEQKLAYWCRQLGWEKVLNRKSTTWRSLLPAVQDKINSAESAIKLMLEYPSLVKRPVVEMNNRVTIGLTGSNLANIKK